MWPGVWVAASASTMESFEKKPAKGGMPALAKQPTSTVA